MTLRDWFDTAEIGDVKIYHRGDLSVDRGKDEGLDEDARTAMLLCRSGAAELYQCRADEVGVGVWLYHIRKVNKLRIERALTPEQKHRALLEERGYTRG